MQVMAPCRAPGMNRRIDIRRGNNVMSEGEAIYLAMVIGAALLFAVVLAVTAQRNKPRT